MRSARIAIATIVLIATLVAGYWPIGPLPPLGKFLHPREGVWAVAATARLPREARDELPTLAGQVRVLYDDRGVPHIFAGSVADAARALGYVVARDRLFQLELQTRATAGTLAELLGPRLLPADRRMRALGLSWSAERDFGELDPASTAAVVVTAYAEGVNAWIDIMGPEDLPLEYRLLNAQPLRWEPAYTYYLIKRMGYTLTYNPHELRRERVSAVLGAEATEALFPLHSPIQEPIIPVQTGGPKDGTTEGEEPVPATVVATFERRKAGMSGGVQPFGRSTFDPFIVVEERGALGSNNWAVAPSRTEAGYALLAGDPHLELTLPSIWYEVHISVPNELDIYGVTIPGVPGVVIGFNRRVAWSFTNTEADVLDFYDETLDDRDQPTAYVVDGTWRPLTRRIEEFRGPRGNVLAIDTVYYTHRGPLQWEGDRPRSLRWTALDEAGSIAALADAAGAESVGDWLAAMAAYRAPPQNMIVADWTGSIAIRSTGRFPVRPGDGRGTVIRDGTRNDSDWLGFLTVDQLPLAVNPPQGFLASANQEPLHPDSNTIYLGANWPSPWRAMRINQLLRSDSAVTPVDMQRFQLDPGSARADRFVPAFLAAAEHSLSQVTGDDELREAAQLLAQWDRQYTRDNERAILFELAMDELVRLTWDELVLPSEDGESRRLSTPGSAVLADLLDQPLSVWWDDGATEDVVEDRDAILGAALKAGLRQAKEEHGSPEDGGWRWGGIRHTNIHHLLRLPSLSALALPIQGGPGTLNPSSGSGVFGASWRMVVELRPDVSAWTIYPGGQSGNPVSPWYRDRIDKWVSGELDPVLFPAQPAALDPDRVAADLTLRPASGGR